MTISPWDSVPPGWEVRPLWTEFRRQKVHGDGTEELLSVYRDYGVIPKASRDDNFNKPSEDLTKYQRVSKGDLVVNKMKAWQGSLGISQFDGIVSPAYFVYKAKGSIDHRYAHYLLRSKAYADHMAAISSGIRPNQWDLDPTQFAVTPLVVPPPTLQRAIADYLDRETAQIDAFIAKNEELIALLTERRAAVIDEALVRAGADSPATPLKRAVDFVTVGIVVTPAKWYVESGVPALRGVNVKPGSILTDDLVFLSDQGHRENRKSELRAGDVLVVRTGQAGAAGVVPPKLDGANAIDLLIVRTGPKVVPEFLAHFLNSNSTSRLIAHGSVGSIQGHFNVGSLRQLPFPQLSKDEQWALVRMLDEQADRIDRAIGTAVRAIELARERRAALISAAATGKIDVGVAA